MRTRSLDNREIFIRLESLDQLFESRPLNPLKYQQLPVSGIELVYARVRLSTGNSIPQLVLELPPGDYDTTRIESAIWMYCNSKMEQAITEHRILTRERYFGLVTGFFFMTLCLGLSYFLMLGEGYPELIRFYLKEGLFIVGWVGMWRPAEIFIFDWWPYRKMLKTYDRLKGIKLRIVTR